MTNTMTMRQCLARCFFFGPLMAVAALKLNSRKANTNTATRNSNRLYNNLLCMSAFRICCAPISSCARLPTGVGKKKNEQAQNRPPQGKGPEEERSGFAPKFKKPRQPKSVTDLMSNLSSEKVTVGEPEAHFKVPELFEDLALLGAGAFGKVYKLPANLLLSERSSSDSGEFVAIKVFPLEKYSAEKMQKALATELAINARINSEYLVGALLAPQWLSDSETVYTGIGLVIELCEGGDLFNLITNGGPIGPKDCAKLLYRLLMGVKHLHEKLVAHRDIKPANVLLEGPGVGTAKLTDFSLATVFDKAGELSMTQKCGTWGFAAPEIYNGPYNELVDVWSVGVAVCFALTGSRKFSELRLGGGSGFSEAGQKQLRRINTSGKSLSDLLCGEILVAANARSSAQEALRNGRRLNW